MLSRLNLLKPLIFRKQTESIYCGVINSRQLLSSWCRKNGLSQAILSSKLWNQSVRRGISFVNRYRQYSWNRYLRCYGYRSCCFPTVLNQIHAAGLADTTSKNGDARKEQEDAEKLRQKTIRHTKWGLLFIGASVALTGLGLVFVYGSPVTDDNGTVIKDDFIDMPILKQYLLRAWREIRLITVSIKEPSREKLLPDALKEPYYQPPYTLVLELNGVLVHPDWTVGAFNYPYNTGWRFKKRPAVDFFISQVGYPTFEVVIYTAEQGFTAFPIIDNLDQNGQIMYRLFRDATKYVDGHHVKDLSKLNRDLSKVIYVDWDTKSFSLQPENALRVPKWEGNDDDTYLADLAALLRTIQVSNVADVRTVLEYYNSFDNPLEAFRENQKRVELEQQKAAEAEKSQANLAKNWSGRLFGYRRHNTG